MRQSSISAIRSSFFLNLPGVRNLSTEVSRLEELGIVHAIRGQKDLEEAAGAYKDIDEVMANQSDLVKIVTALSPVAVIKG